MIEQIGSALSNILRKELSDILPKPAQIGVYLPQDRGETVLGLYLYSIRNCSELNAGAVVGSGRNIKSIPPRFLTLYYLMTVYSAVDLHYRALDEHRILTSAMEVFERNPVLNEGKLGFKPGVWVEELRLQFADLDVAEMSYAWNKDVPYRLSVAYKVCPVELNVVKGSISRRISETDSDFSNMNE